MTMARSLRLLISVFFAVPVTSLIRPAHAADPSGGPGYQTFVIGDEAARTPDPVVGGLLLNGGGDPSTTPHSDSRKVNHE